MGPGGTVPGGPPCGGRGKDGTIPLTCCQNGRKEYIKPYTKEEVDSMMNAFNIKLERNKLCDAAYVANMAKADFLGSSIASDEHLAKYVKDVIDDPDAIPGYVFNRFYADCMFMDNPIDWDEMI